MSALAAAVQHPHRQVAVLAVSHLNFTKPEAQRLFVVETIFINTRDVLFM